MWGKVGAVMVGFLLLLCLTMFGQIFENVDADEFTVIQSPAGTLRWYTTPGWKFQGFGKVTTYRIRSLYEINSKMRFNDGAHGTLTGSIQYELPRDESQMTQLHTKFGSQEAIQGQLVKTIVDKAVYMTGPLMSSKESYAEKRNALIAYVEDQVESGVYRTRQREERQKDPITGAEKTVTIVEIVMDNGVPKRQEQAVLTPFGIKPFNFSISELKYDDAVEKQIQAQQQATMDVQTAMANARKAEQDALTVAKQGEAKAAAAKWEQEAIKAKEVTKAEQEKAVAVTQAEKTLEVARLDTATAEQYKQKKIKEAEGDATYKREVLEADGALAQKLATYERVQNAWANAYANRKTPTTIIGAGMGGSGSDSDATSFQNMLNALIVKDIALDRQIPSGK